MVKAPGGGIPRSAYVALGRGLYHLQAPLYAALAVCSLAAVIVCIRQPDDSLLAATAALVVLSFLRIGLNLAFHNWPGGLRDEDVGAWRMLYAVGGFAHSATLGFLAMFVIAGSPDPVSHMVIAIVAVGYAAGTAGRNAGCLEVCLPQMAAILVPMAAGFLIRGGLTYDLLALMTVAFILGLARIAQGINGSIVNAYHLAREREAATERFDAALATVRHGFALIDAEGRLEACSASLATHLGFALPQGDRRMALTDVVVACSASGTILDAGAALSTLLGLVAARDHAEADLELSGGRTVRLSVSPRQDGGCVLIAEDVTEELRAARSLSLAARRDALTGLLNRAALDEALDARLAEGPALSLLTLDLDRFKEANDTHGHAVGDALLRAVADRLRRILPADALAARFGGDEFALLLPEGPAGSHALAAAVVAAIDAPFSIDGREIVVTASVGVASSPEDGSDGRTLMRNADAAMYRVKDGGRCGWRPFDRDLDAEIQERHALEADLRRAAQEDQFEVHYQPQIDLKSGRVVACEALVRWRHPVRGFVPPSLFVPIAEETGLIDRIGRLVLEKACRAAVDWPAHVRVAVNLSPVQFRHDLPAAVAAALDAAGLPGHRLELEMTESLFLENREEVQGAFLRLTAMGIQLALDDFGTGYSSLSQLRSFPFRKLKIDRSFVSDVERDPGAHVILKALCNLGRDLGMGVVIEGIETQGQRDAVAALGCHDAQGYGIARPMPAGEVAAFLDGYVALAA